MAEFLAGLTFLAFFMLEEVVHLSFSAAHNNDNPDHDHHNHKHEHEHKQEQVELKSHNEHSHLLTTSSSSPHDENHADHHAPPARRSSSLCQSHLSNDHHHYEIFESMHAPKSQQHEHHHHDDHISQHLHGSLLASMMLLLALSVHSILEGLAIGASSNPQEILATTLAILAHKGFAGYALGSSMVASELNPYHFYVLITLFACCTPLGVACGYLFFARAKGEQSALATAVLQAMVAGTFLYVAIVEVAMKELMSCRQGGPVDHACDTKRERQRLIAFVFGYLAMSALALFV